MPHTFTGTLTLRATGERSPLNELAARARVPAPLVARSIRVQLVGMNAHVELLATGDGAAAPLIFWCDVTLAELGALFAGGEIEVRPVEER